MNTSKDLKTIEPKIVMLYCALEDKFYIIIHDNLEEEIFDAILENLRKPSNWFVEKFCECLGLSWKSNKYDDLVISGEWDGGTIYFDYTLEDLILNGSPAVITFLIREYGFRLIHEKNFYNNFIYSLADYFA